MIRIDEKHQDVINLKKGEMKLNEFCARHAAKNTELERLTLKYLAARKLSRVGQLEAEGHELLVGSAKPDLTPYDIERTQHDVEVLEAAIHEQRQVVDGLRGKYSLVLCEANRSQYLEIEKRISRAVQALANANEDEVKFFRELEDAGASIRFRPMRVVAVGVASDSESLANRHRREVEEFLPEAAT
jgi:hypothetical protein